jgi:hypothetical protein
VPVQRTLEEVVERLGGGGHPKVSVTVDGFTFRTSIAKMGGRFLLGVSTERRAQSGIEAGQVFDVDVELDTAPREVEKSVAMLRDGRAR